MEAPISKLQAPGKLQTSNPGWLEVWQDDLVHQDPPFPFLDWNEQSLRRHLANNQFDLGKPIIRISDERGLRWVQRAPRS